MIGLSSCLGIGEQVLLIVIEQRAATLVCSLHLLLSIATMGSLCNIGVCLLFFFLADPVSLLTWFGPR